MLLKIKSLRSLNKSKKVLRHIFKLYRKKERTLDAGGKEQIQNLLSGLQAAILQKNSAHARKMAQELEQRSRHLMPRSTLDKTRDFIGSIGFALFVALIIRQMWFEPYTIPSGSMRPTLKEGDYLVVSKTDYGINTPFRSGHFYFDPALVERGSIVVFTGENMDMPNDDTMYFYIIPGKKQYVKRLIAKPGDTLYFYGGQIYGINSRGRELIELRDDNYFKNLEHIPFIRFEGKAEAAQTGDLSTILYQMNQPVAKLAVNPIGTVKGEVITQKGHPPLSHYSDLWGFKHLAMTRLLTETQAKQLTKEFSTASVGSGVLYLEIHHHPSLQNAQVIRDELGRMRPGLNHTVSLLPLSQEHLDALMNQMTTCRFEVKNGRAYRVGFSDSNEMYAPQLPTVPDGVYEFQNGIASRVFWSGISKQLPSDHPLLSRDLAHVQLLYNLGFEWHTYFQPSAYAPLPSRYAYFRNGDLYLMGGPVVKKGDPLLTLFFQREYQKQSMSTSVRPYLPFDDAGPPLTKEGKIDIEFVKKYGLTIPDKMYLALGDNHAMSGDSRLFGFVPQDNLRGGVSFLFWPPGERWSRLPQATTLHLTIPNLTVWALALTIFLISYLYFRRKYFSPFRFDKET